VREQLGLLKPASDIVSRATAVDLSCFGHTSAARLPCWSLMLTETGGRVVDPVTLSVVFVVGFAVGYAVRERKSRMRRRRYNYRAED